MSTVKNRAIIYAIMRRVGDRDVVCCFTDGVDRAEELRGEYDQKWKDTFGSTPVYFYVAANTFYSS